VTAKWGLPPAIIEILDKHHLNKCALEEIEDVTTARSVATVHLANQACKVLGIGYRSPNESISLCDLPSTQFLDLSPEKLEAMVAEIGETFKSEKEVFQ
jgi:hypothetical protein